MTTAQKSAVDEILQFERDEGYSPHSLLNVIIFETGGTLSPAAKNSNSSATGLIQFMEITAIRLGVSTAKLSAMTVKQQLFYVKKYLQPYKAKIQAGNWLDLYLAVLYPALIGKPDSAVMTRADSMEYRANQGLDFDRNGIITRGEIGQRFKTTVENWKKKNGVPLLGFDSSSKLGIYAAVGAFMIGLYFYYF